MVIHRDFPPFRPPNWKFRLTYIGLAIIVVISLFFLSQVFIVVPAGQRVVIFNAFTGLEPRAPGEGMHILIPFVESAKFYDVRTQTYTMSGVHSEGEKLGDDSVSALTSDGQVVKMDITVRFHPEPEYIWKLHQQVGSGFVDKIIRPEARTIVRNAVSSYSVTEVYSGKRQSIQDEMQAAMTKSLEKYFISLDELLIRNIVFSEAFAQAIEQKQVAYQEAERMKYVLQKEESEKQRKIIEATGDAEAIKKRAEALRENPQLIQYEFVKKLAPGVKAIITDQNTIMNFGDFLKD